MPRAQITSRLVGSKPGSRGKHLPPISPQELEPLHYIILADYQALVKLGATRAEVVEALGTAIYMGGGPSLMYAANAIKAFDEAAS